MELKDYWLALRTRWPILVLLTLAGLLLGLVVSLVLPKTYEAHTELFVAPDTGSTSSELVQGSTFVQDRVKSYVQVVDTGVVLQPVIDQLGLDTTVTELAEDVTATVITDTTVIEITVEDGSADEAADIANAVAKQLATIAPTLEPSGDKNTPLVRITVVNPASPPSSPASPVLAFNLALGLLIGLAVGLAVAIARQALDQRIKSTEEISAVSSAAVLARVPSGPAAVEWAQRGVASGPAVEALRQLRTTLQTTLLEKGSASCLITSAVAGEGRTTIAVGLARTFAEGGHRVCLVDTDLRRPAVARILALEDGPGLSGVLAGELPWRSAMVPAETAGLEVLPAGPAAPDPAPLLAGTAVERLISDLEVAYDVVVLDGPPLLPVADGPILAAASGGTLVVVGAGKRAVTLPQLRDGLSKVEAVDGRVLGFVANRFTRRR